MTIPPLPDVAGTAFPGGRYRLDRRENADFCVAVGAVPDGGGRAHPLFYYIAAQRAMGLTVDALLARCDFDVADGPLMTGSSVTFSGELRVDQDYEVTGEIVSLVRKPSRTFGTVDLLTFRLALALPGGAVVAQCVNSWMLPRREAA